MKAQMDAMALAEERRSRAARGSTAAYTDQGAALAKVVGQIDPTVAALGKLDALQSKLAGFKAKGLIDDEGFAEYTAKINASRAALTGAGEAASHLSLNSAGAKREIGVLAAEMARGDFTKFEGSLLTLANRAGALSLVFSPLGIAIGLTIGVLGGLFALFVAGERESDAFNRGILATGNFAGQSTGSLRNLASAVGASTGEYGKAEEAISKLLSSGKLSGEAFEAAAQGAVAMATVTGESVDKAVGEFDKLSKDPLDGAVKLNEQYHFLTGAVYDQIKALQDQGETTGATTLAVKTLAETMEQRRAAMVDSAGIVEKAWRAVKDVISGAIDNVKQIGRTDLDAQLHDAYAKQFDIDQSKKGLNAGGLTGFINNFDPNYATTLAHEDAANQAVIKSLQEKVAAQQKANDDAAKQHALADQEVDAQKEIDATLLRLDKQAQKQKAIQDLNASFTKLFNGPNAGDDTRLADVTKTPDGFTGGAYSKALAEINEKYGDHGKAARDAAKADRELDAAIKAQTTSMSALEKISDDQQGKVDPVVAAWARYVDTMRNIVTQGGKAVEQIDNINSHGGESVSLATIQERVVKASDDATAAWRRENAELEKRSKLTTGNVNLLNQLAQQRDRILGLTSAQVAYNAGVEKANRDAADDIAKGLSQQEVAKGLADRLHELAEIRDEAPVASLVEQFGSKSEFDKLVEDIGRVQDALTKATDPAGVDRLSVTLGALRQKMLTGIVDSAQAGLRSLQSMTTQGSKAFQVLQVAIDATTLANAIGVVINQGFGDPYTAFARMAAMAAAVAALGVDIGNFGGGGPSADSAEERQKVQGTGSVLGDAQAQSESISKALDITANATTQLVGLNRGMLTALQALQSALGAAGNQLARGAGDVSLPGAHSTTQGLLGPLGALNPVLNALTSDPIGSAIGGFVFGGKQKVIDQGIQIIGGQLGDMLNGIVVGAYNTVHTSGGLLGSGSTDTNFSEIGGEFAKQFGLVINSIADAVRQGALALGLLPADIEKAIDEFQIATTQISLKGLSADDQQKAIEAVFSQIFDGLAGAVVPFIGQFQQVGEGLGETLIRVATEVQVSQEAFKQLGITVDETDPEKFAQIADGLVKAAGGLDAFISSMQSFVDKFAPDSAKFQFETDALNSGLSQVGLTLPTTREGMYALMQSLDATTDAGRQQIATLLRLTDTADAYYDELEKRADSLNQYGDFIANLDAGTGKLSSFAQSRLQIEQWERDTIKQANALAKAAGLQGASEQDLTLIHQVAAHKISDAIAELQASTQDLVDKLYRNGQSYADAAGTGTSALRGFGSAITSVAESAAAAAQLLLGDLSPLNDNQKLQYALQAFDRGQVSKQDVLQIGQRLYGSSQPYVDLFNSLANRPDNNVGAAGGGGGGGASGSASSQQETAAQRHADAETIAQNVASLANVQHESFQQVADSLHLSLKDLSKDLGLSDSQLNDYLQNAVDMENAIPDSLDGNFDRLIAALYNIAGLPAPSFPTDADSVNVNTPQGGRGGTATTISTDTGAGTGTGSVIIPRGHSQHAVPSTTTVAPDPESTALLASVAAKLDAILAATRNGNLSIVEAVQRVSSDTRDVGRTIERAGVEALAVLPRGSR
ncbi:MAG: phage tail length tape measure family protein [Dokdonella sp.]